ncbi:MAG: response regulator [Bacillota bacterium]
MKSILIIDDSAFMRVNIINIIKEMNLEVAGQASNGQEGIEKYKKLKPDLVIMDITMPKMSGITALKKIIEFDEKAKVIICSAMSQQPLVIEAIEAGAEDFIVKPFYKSKVKNTINTILDL